MNDHQQNNTTTMQENEFDAIVVGSGISGGWAAKELCEKGLKVIVLERGKDVKHVTDYKNAMKAPWEFPHRGSRTQKMIEDYPVLKRDYPLNETNLDWWASDKDSPYTEVKRFDWFRGYQVGGRSLLWGRQSYRWSDFDFEGNVRDGVGVDWPVRYKDIESWYTYVEKFAGISGSREGLPQLPDSHFLPAMELNCVERDAADRDIVGGRSAAYEKELHKAREIAFEEMQEQARQLGANAIIGIDLDYEVVGQGGSMLMVTASGTAVRV